MNGEGNRLTAAQQAHPSRLSSSPDAAEILLSNRQYAAESLSIQVDSSRRTKMLPRNQALIHLIWLGSIAATLVPPRCYPSTGRNTSCHRVDVVAARFYLPISTSEPPHVATVYGTCKWRNEIRSQTQFSVSSKDPNPSESLYAPCTLLR